MTATIKLPTISIAIIPKNNKQEHRSKVVFLLLFCLVNTHIRANSVVVGVVISAGIVVGHEIRLGGVGLHIGEDIIDFVCGRIISAKAMQSGTYQFGSVYCAKAVFCGKIGLDNAGIGSGIEVTCEDIGEF